MCTATAGLLLRSVDLWLPSFSCRLSWDRHGASMQGCLSLHLSKATFCPWTKFLPNVLWQLINYRMLAKTNEPVITSLLVKQSNNAQWNIGQIVGNTQTYVTHTWLITDTCCVNLCCGYTREVVFPLPSITADCRKAPILAKRADENGVILTIHHKLL